MDLEDIKAALEAGKIDEARDCLLAIVESDPNETRAWLLLAGVAVRSEDWQLGARTFDALVALRPADCLAPSGLVECLVKLGRNSEALAEIDRFASWADDRKSNDRIVLDEQKAIAEGIRLV